MLGTNGYLGIGCEGRILFHCSFERGGSGSPGIAIVGNRATAVTVLLCGYPGWFYEPEVDQNIKITVPNNYRIEQGIRMEYLYRKMLEKVSDICIDIFGPIQSIPMDVE